MIHELLIVIIEPSRINPQIIDKSSVNMNDPYRNASHVGVIMDLFKERMMN